MSKNAIIQIAVLRKLLQLNDGRDKLLKLIQYICKVLVAYEPSIPFVVTDTTKSISLLTLEKSKLQKLAAAFGLTRRIIHLGHVLEPLNKLETLAAATAKQRRVAESLQASGNGNLVSPPPSVRTVVRTRAVVAYHVINVFYDIVLDIVCLGKIGVLSKPWLDKYEPLASKLWYSTIFLDMHENLNAVYDLQREMDELKMQQRLQAENEDKVETGMRIRRVTETLRMQQLGVLKLAADFVYCSYDVWELGSKGWSDRWQALSALTAASIATIKLYSKYA